MRSCPRSVLTLGTAFSFSIELFMSFVMLSVVQVCSELEGKDINEVIDEGMGKLASMPSGNHYTY